jgi:hypothetical protein
MTITPPELLDTSIARLQRLVVFLDDQLDWAESAAVETRACKRPWIAVSINSDPSSGIGAQA